MSTNFQRSARHVPRWQRACLQLCLIVGILGVHSLLIVEPASASHHGVVAASSDEHAGQGSSVAAIGDAQASGAEDSASTSDCGVLMLCIAMIVGFGALIGSRNARSSRVLWQLPPPLRTRRATKLLAAKRAPPFATLSVLRC